MGHHRTTSALLTVLVCFASADECRIVAQSKASRGSCGPSSVSNWLIHGNPEARAVFESFPGEDDESKVLYLISRYASKPSEVFARQEKARYDNGMQPTDLLRTVEDIVAQNPGLRFPVAGGSLMRPRTLSLPEHLRQVHAAFHRSIAAGVPVIAHLRSYRTWSEGKGGRLMWGFQAGHYIVVTEVQAKLREAESGFTFAYVDSTGHGERGHGYIHIAHRDFRAKVWDGDMPGPGEGWHDDRPFLLVTAPDLRLGKATEWKYRQFTILNYAVHSGAGPGKTDKD